MKTVLLTAAFVCLLIAPVFAQKPTPAEVLDLKRLKISLPIDEIGKGKVTRIDEKAVMSTMKISTLMKPETVLFLARPSKVC